ncbi:MAG: hypothetical protein ACTS4Y_01035 [Candidatus Hodgkinia cicadicola]
MQVWNLFLRWNLYFILNKINPSLRPTFRCSLPPKVNSFGRSIFTSAAFVYNFVRNAASLFNFIIEALESSFRRSG